MSSGGWAYTAVARMAAWHGVVRWALPVAWAALLWWASGQTSLDLGDPAPWKSFVHNGGHVAAYAILGALLLIALPDRGRTYWAVGLATAYGCIDEIHQSFVPGRGCSVADMVSDACGAVLALLVVVPLQRREPVRWRAVGAWVAVCLLSVLWATLADG